MTGCTHCGSAIPASGTSDRFCCSGCEAAYHIVSGLGLERYYARREIDLAARRLKPDGHGGPVDFQRHSRLSDDGSIGQINLMIDGIHCAACVWLIESVLAKQPGIIEARVNMTTRRLRVSWDATTTSAEDLLGPVIRLGYRLVPFDPKLLDAHNDWEQRDLYRCLAVSAFAAANVMLLSVSVWAGHFQGMGPAMRDYLHWISALIAIPTVVYAGRPFYRSAIDAMRHGRVSMDMPISLAITLATLMSLHEVITSGEHAYFDSAVTLLFFLLIGRVLDRRARMRARSSAEYLLALNATAVTIIDDQGNRKMVPPADIKNGMTALVAAGERIGVDGEVITGRSDVDSQLISGESLPEAVDFGSKVFAGAMNLTSPLTLKVTAAGEDTLLAEIVRLMEGAEKGRAAYVALADRVSSYYSPVVHVLGAATFLAWWLFIGEPWQDALLKGIAVLIITCPCALALAVPVVQVIASARLMRQGILLKSATALERLAQITHVIFDKTGTLTEGHPALINKDDLSSEELSLAASMAANSRHPLAKAICLAVPNQKPLGGVEEIAGQGLIMRRKGAEIRLGSRSFIGVADDHKAIGAELWLARDGHAPKRFVFEDSPKEDAADVVNALLARSCIIQVLSGDRVPTVAALARKLGIDHFEGGLKPADKTDRLAALDKQGATCLMVGDGLNDAPALAAAAVSMSPTTAADVSQTAADIVFQGDRLGPVIETLDVSRKADVLVKQNIALAFLYNVVTIPLAMAGYVTPLVAAIAMSTSSIVVIANALRLSRKKHNIP